jgi:hypothetical protein
MTATYAGVSDTKADIKQAWSTFTTDENNWLVEHRNRLEQENSRKNLSNEAMGLNVRKEVYLSKAFEINIEVMSGKMQDAINQVKALNTEFLDKAKSQDIDTEKQDLAIRGLETNLERLARLTEDVAIIRQDFMDESGYVDEEQFNNISQDFVPLYQQLRQLTTLTRELAKDIQW